MSRIPPTPALKLGYRPELDGLRGISILLVYLHHLYYPLMPGGFFGVDIFFVLLRGAENVLHLMRRSGLSGA